MDGVERPSENTDPTPSPSGHGQKDTPGAARHIEALSVRRSPRIRRAVARLLLRAGLSPNAVTVMGTFGVVAAAICFAARGQLLTATFLGAIFSYGDLVDGEMARLGKRASAFGALLDSVLDRVADGAIFASLAYWLFTSGERWQGVAALLCLVSGSLVPYVRARAEGLQLSGDTGIASRFVRLKIIAVGGLLAGFDVPHGLAIVLWLLAILSMVTVWQRLSSAHHQLLRQNAHLNCD